MEGSPLFGKRISVNGDSICQGVGHPGGYVKIIAERNSMTYENLGIGGGTVATGIVPKSSAEGKPRHPIAVTVDRMDPDADYAIVEGGVNDVVAVNKSNLDIVLPKDAGINDLRFEYEIPGGKLTAPLEAGQKITDMRLWYKGRCVGETVLYAQNAVASAEEPGFTVQDGASRFDDDMAKMLAYVGMFLLIFIGLASIYLGINAARRAAAKKRARRKRRQQRDARMQHRRR